MILGYLVVTSVLVVSLGRLGDMYGRVRMYNLGFVIYTRRVAAARGRLADGPRRARPYLIVFRIVQGVGGACLLANAAAIITDAFPANQRGMALGINNIVGVSGTVHRAGARRPAGADRLAAGVPDLGPGRAVRHGLGLPEAARSAASRDRAPIDWWGNVTFALGPDPDHGRRHLRDPPLRRRTRPAGAARACWRCSAAGSRAWRRSW